MRILACMAVMLLVVSAASAGDEIKGKVSVHGAQHTVTPSNSLSISGILAYHNLVSGTNDLR